MTIPAQTSSGTSGAHYVDVGSYTGNVKGIYVFRSEPFDGGSVTAFAIDPMTGLLIQLNMHPAQGANPASPSVHPSGKFALAANYCALGPDSGRQQARYLHFTFTGPSGKWVLVNAPGPNLTYIHAFDLAFGKFAPCPSAKHDGGSGPHHFGFHPHGETGGNAFQFRTQVAGTPDDVALTTRVT